MNIELPVGWIEEKLGNVCKINMGQSPPSETYNYDKVGLPFFQGKAEFTHLHPVPVKWCSAPTKIAQPGDILLSVRAPVGALNIANQKCCIGRGLASIKSSDNQLFIYYYLKYIEKELDKKGTGTTFKAISGDTLRNVKIPYPCSDQQIQIIQKIEELFSELDKGIESLKIAQEQLKLYRQAVLKWAFEGKLTITDDAWSEIKLEQVANAIDPQPSHRTPPVYKGGIPYISIKDFNSELDTIDFTNARSVSPEVLKEHQNRYQIQLGDFVIGKIGTIGKPVRLVLPQNYTLSANIVLIQPRKINSTFLYYFFQSSQIEKEFIDGKSATSQAAFGIKKVRELNIKIPSDIEQLEIVQEIESRLSVCDKIDEAINASLKQTEALRQSILKKAFEGKLVKAQINPIYKPKNVYFHQMQLLGLVVARSKEKGINHGEMTIAKFAYLIDKIYQVPTYYEFKRWHLGPYPPEIKKAINNTKFFAKKNNVIEVKDLDTLTKYTNPYSDKLNAAITDLSNIFTMYNSKERSHKIELLATVCKVIEDIQLSDLKEIRNSMLEWKIDLPNTNFKNKAEKFSEDETHDCLQLIIENNWISNLIENG